MRILSFLFLFFGLIGPTNSHVARPSSAEMFLPPNCNLPAPTTLTISNITATTATGAWSAVPGAANYLVQVNLASTGATVYTNTTSATTDVATGLSSATKYIFKVFPIDPTGCVSSNAKSEAFATPFVIIDETVSAYPAPPTPTGWNVHNQNSPITLPAYFAIRKNGTVEDDSKFSIELSTLLGGTLQMAHKNAFQPSLVSCKGQAVPNYIDKWQFANENSLPPAALAGWDKMKDAMSVRCYVHGSYANCFNQDDPVFTLTIFRDQQGNLYLKHSASTYYEVVRPAPVLLKGNNGSNATISAAPNPFDASLSLLLPPNDGRGGLIQLFDFAGKIVRAQSVGEGESTAEIATPDLAPGVYFLRFDDGVSIETLKVVKME